MEILHTDSDWAVQMDRNTHEPLQTQEKTQTTHANTKEKHKAHPSLLFSFASGNTQIHTI